MTARTAWHGLRGLRWLLWAAFVVFALVYWLDSTKYHNQFGNLLLWGERWDAQRARRASRLVVERARQVAGPWRRLKGLVSPKHQLRS